MKKRICGNVTSIPMRELSNESSSFLGVNFFELLGVFGGFAGVFLGVFGGVGFFGVLPFFLDSSSVSSPSLSVEAFSGVPTTSLGDFLVGVVFALFALSAILALLVVFSSSSPSELVAVSDSLSGGGTITLFGFP